MSVPRVHAQRHGVWWQGAVEPGVVVLFVSLHSPIRPRMFHWCREIQSCVYPPGRTPSRLQEAISGPTLYSMMGSDQGMAVPNSYAAIEGFWSDDTPGGHSMTGWVIP